MDFFSLSCEFPLVSFLSSFHSKAKFFWIFTWITFSFSFGLSHLNKFSLNAYISIRYLISFLNGHSGSVYFGYKKAISGFLEFFSCPTYISSQRRDHVLSLLINPKAYNTVRCIWQVFNKGLLNVFFKLSKIILKFFFRELITQMIIKEVKNILYKHLTFAETVKFLIKETIVKKIATVIL